MNSSPDIKQKFESLDENANKQPLGQDLNESNNSEISLNKAPFSPFATQFRALFKKNINVQAKQMGTNICQVITPIICLLIVYLIKVLAESHPNAFQPVSIDFPYLFNIPYKNFYDNASLPLKLTTCLQWYLYDTSEADAASKQYVEEMLAKATPEELEQEFYCNQYKRVMPFFEEPDVNTTINSQIFETIQYLNEQPFEKSHDIWGLDALPDGAITFYNASNTNLTFKLQINDNRLPGYHRTNGVTKLYVETKDDKNKTKDDLQMRVADGQLALLDLVSRSYINQINNDVILLSGVQYMPITVDEKGILDKIFSIVGASLYPIALSLLLPVYMYSIVLEKEERLQEMMKMNGMKIKYYWFVNYLWDFTLFMIACLIFMFFGSFILETSFFTDTSQVVLWTVLIGWGLAQVSLSFFFQNFVAKARSATIVGYLLSVWTTITAISFNLGVYPLPQEIPYGMRVYPPFAFCRLIYDLSIQCSNGQCYTSISDFTDEMMDCLVWQYIGAFIFLVLGIYLSEVWPQEYGVRKHPLFFLKSCLNKNKEKKDQYFEISESKLTEYNIDLSGEDEDAKKERTTVDEIPDNSYHKYPLIIKNLRKVYKAQGGRPPKVAVKLFSLHIERGEMFGLLGPNGAGKTSLISMLTGLYPPEAGNAWVAGADIINQIELVRSNMGVCPQFDLLWPSLTVKEHLLFYARLRGIDSKEENEVVEKAMSEVYLTKFSNFRVKQLSGGMKRRLSVAISLVGDPKIIFLDEPTTGLDPENRRQLWDILVEARGNRAMVLTTHSMEEADVLCTRIGIITQGTLRCIGPQTRLKSLYGGGYHLFINCHKDGHFLKNRQSQISSQQAAREPEYYHKRVAEVIPQILPHAEMKSSFNGNFIFQIPMKGLEVSKIFEELESRKEELAISDWGISQSSLEDVFLEIAKESEQDEEPLKK